MAGEGVVDRRLVRMVKTHWPERRGWCPVQAQRAVLLVRNPFDAIDSYFNMCLTNTHHLSLTEEVYAEFTDTWRAMMRSEAKLWGAFHQWWLQSGVPLFVVRYEDLRADPETVLDALDLWLHKPLSSLTPSNSSSLSTNGATAEQQRQHKGEIQSKAGQSLPEPLNPRRTNANGSEEEKQQQRQEGQSPTRSQPSTANDGTNGVAKGIASDGNNGNSSEDSTLSSSAAGSKSLASSSEGTPYTPRSAGLSNRQKAFARCDEELVAAVVAGAGPTLLKGFGYLPTTAAPAPSTPTSDGCDRCKSSELPIPQSSSPPLPQAQPPLRQPDYTRGANTRPGKAKKEGVVLNALQEKELRGPDDKFGRYMTIFRKQHTVGDTQPFPVVSGEPYRLHTPVYT